MKMIRTPQLILLPSSQVKTERLLDYENRNRFFFEPWVPLRNQSFFEDRVQRLRLQQEVKEAAEQRSFRLYIATVSEPECVVGDIGVSNIVRGVFHSAYLGYKIDKQYQGRGLMREALSAIMEFSFMELGLHRLEANIMPRNLRSIALVEKLHFQREGYSRRYLRINGVWEDHIRYAYLSSLNEDKL